MNRFLLPALAGSLALAACATVPADDVPEDREVGTGGGECSAQPAQRFVGQQASAETGGAILAATGARTLRWGPPDTMFTMDFRPDRVNVMYDAGMTITQVRCG